MKHVCLQQSNSTHRQDQYSEQNLKTLYDRRHLSVVILALFLMILCAAVIGAPNMALAQNSLPSNVRVLLGFRERYGPDNRQHLGVDVYAPRGSEIRAPIDGTISFLGRVPGSAGLNVTAITIRTADGDLVSINPFLTTAVSAGDTVRRGQALGTISDVGDPSSPESNFHLSLRVNGVYRDPTHLLAEAAGAISVVGNSPSNTSSAPAPSSAPTQAPTTAPGTVVAPTTSPAVTPSVSSAPACASTSSLAATSNIGLVQGSSSAIQNSSVQASSAVTAHDGRQALKGVSHGGLSVASIMQYEFLASNNIVQSRNVAFAAQDMLTRQSALATMGTESAFAMATPSGEQTLQGDAKAQKVGLHAEVMMRTQDLSQFQLTAGLFAAFCILLSAGIGMWRVVQILGIDTSALNLRKQTTAAINHAWVKNES